MATKTETKDVSRRIQNILANSNAESGGNAGYETATSSSESEDEVEVTPQPTQVRGARLGQRFWKDDRKRFSWTAIKSRPKKTLEEHNKIRQELKHIKGVSRAIKAERAQLKEQKRERRRENLKKRQENAKKSEVIQVIKNPSKLKKMKKKMLRQIEKRDTTAFE